MPEQLPGEHEAEEEGHESRRPRWPLIAGGAALLLGLGSIPFMCNSCKEKPVPKWEEVTEKEAIPEYTVTNKPNERDSYTGRITTSTKTEGGRTKNVYEFPQIRIKGTFSPSNRVWNDIDVGDEVKIRGSSLDNVDLRDNYITGTIDTVSIRYFENTMGVKVGAQIYVGMTDANGKQVGLVYEGIPVTAEAAYGKLTGVKGTQIPVKLPRSSDDLGSALIGMK